MPCSFEKPAFIDGKGWMSLADARKALRLNVLNPVWSDVEKEIVDTCDTLKEAWHWYQIAFGSEHRTYEAIRRRWNRSHHKKVP